MGKGAKDPENKRLLLLIALLLWAGVLLLYADLWTSWKDNWPFVLFWIFGAFIILRFMKKSDEQRGE